jgi:putative tricarboxylic transport membrane protein
MKISKEQGGSLFFLILGTYGLIFSVQLPFGKMEEPGPAMFPFGLSILLFISGLLWFIRGRETAEEISNWRDITKMLTQPAKIIVSTAIFIFFFERLGFLLGATLYLIVLFVWVSRFKIWIAFGLALGIGIGSWLFFGRLLAVQLPQGPLPF